MFSYRLPAVSRISQQKPHSPFFISRNPHTHLHHKLSTMISLIFLMWFSACLCHNKTINFMWVIISIQKQVSYWFTAKDNQTAAAFFSFILFWSSMILARTASFSFLISSSLASFSFCFLSSMRKRLLFYVDSFSHRQMVSAAMFILVTPFINSSLQEFRVLAELQKLELNSGNFLVRRQRDNLLSKFFFSRALYSLLSYVAFSTSTSNTFNLSVSSSFYFLTQSSFSSAFFLKSSSMPPNFPFKLSIFSFNSAFSLSNASLSFQNSAILFLMSSNDFSKSSSIFCLFLTSSQTLSLTVFWMLRIVFLISSMPLSILCFSSMRFNASRLNFSFSDFIFSWSSNSTI